jgi:hypothetical protein
MTKKPAPPTPPDFQPSAEQKFLLREIINSCGELSNAAARIIAEGFFHDHEKGVPKGYKAVCNNSLNMCDRIIDLMNYVVTANSMGIIPDLLDTNVVEQIVVRKDAWLKSHNASVPETGKDTKH